MGRAFTDKEIERIREKLIESCRICWNQYGYKKTNVSEIAKMASISTGALYAFFPSKEILFLETADFYTKQIMEQVKRNIPANPTKYDFAEGVKTVLKELNENRWIFSLREEYEQVIRNLPAEYVDRNLKKDLLDFQGIIDLYGLVPKIRLEEIIAIIHILSFSLFYPEAVGDYQASAIDLLIDGVVEKIF